jgi:hypothetical protein
VKIIKFTKHNYVKYVIIFSLLISFSLAISSSFITSNNPCRSCHNIWYEYCNLRESDISTYLPTVIEDKYTDIRISVEISGNGRNRYYEIDRLSVSFDSTNNFVKSVSPVKEYRNLYPGDKIIVDWEIEAMKNGLETLQFSLSAYNSHENSRFYDSYSYQALINIGNDTNRDPAIKPSSWSIDVGENVSYLSLYINRTVTDLHFEGHDGFEINPTYADKLFAGDELVISISTNSEQRLERVLNILWIENTTENSISILLVHNLPIEESFDYFGISGRILGITCFILLFFSMLLGGITKKLKTYFNINLSAVKRVKIHCYLSWLLMILSITHGLILIIKPYNEFFWSPEILLGDISALFMLIVSVNGSFMKVIIRVTGASTWRWMHRLFSWASVILVVVHAVLIGTDFAFIKEALNL